MKLILAMSILILAGCAKTPCTGGVVNGQCLQDPSASTQWDQSSALRAKKGVTCTPQALTKALVSQNNFYSYRDGREYLDLNGATGEFRKLTIAEGKSGQRVYTRLQGCFYQRSDATFGDQLLLDTTYARSDQWFDPLEIFTYTTTANAMNMVRFDDSQLWSYQECVTLDTPDQFCQLLRNGNTMYFPNGLTPAQKADLLAEAIAIRRIFNFDTVSRSAFDGIWSQGGTVAMREDYKFAVQAIVDTPQYIDQAWIKFLRRQSNTMPDLTSNRIPQICFPSSQVITYGNGTTGRIYGEACYVDGNYEFSQ